MPGDPREVAALRNLGQVMLDPTLGFCEPLATRFTEPAANGSILEETARAAWSPLFGDRWVPKPVRAFFRRVSLSIDEIEPFERTVSPDTQAWMILALLQAGRRWGWQGGVWADLSQVFREMAFRAAHFVAEHLVGGAGLVEPELFDVFDTAPALRFETSAYHQGIWLEALAGLHTSLRTDSPDRAAEVQGWAALFTGHLQGWLQSTALRPLPAAGKARLLQGISAAQASPAWYEESLEGWQWNLVAELIDTQEPDGSWEGSVRATAEVIAAVARCGRSDVAAVYPDALGRAIAWLRTMQPGNGTLPASMPGLRVWDYSLDDVGALLECARQGVHALLHPEDHQTLVTLSSRWWGAALGSRCRIPHSLKYGGQWVAGMRYVKETKAWFRDLRIEPGAISRMALEGFAFDEGNEPKEILACAGLRD